MYNISTYFNCYVTNGVINSLLIRSTFPVLLNSHVIYNGYIIQTYVITIITMDEIL